MAHSRHLSAKPLKTQTKTTRLEASFLALKATSVAQSPHTNAITGWAQGSSPVCLVISTSASFSGFCSNTEITKMHGAYRSCISIHICLIQFVSHQISGNNKESLLFRAHFRAALHTRNIPLPIHMLVDSFDPNQIEQYENWRTVRSTEVVVQS